MRKTPYPTYISKRKEHSYDRFAIRARKDECLQEAAENYMSKHPAKLNDLVDMLLDDQFSHARYTDPEYPL